MSTKYWSHNALPFWSQYNFLWCLLCSESLHGNTSCIACIQDHKVSEFHEQRRTDLLPLLLGTDPSFQGRLLGVSFENRKWCHSSTLVDHSRNKIPKMRSHISWNPHNESTISAVMLSLVTWECIRGSPTRTALLISFGSSVYPRTWGRWAQHKRVLITYTFDFAMSGVEGFLQIEYCVRIVLTGCPTPDLVTIWEAQLKYLGIFDKYSNMFDQ